MEISKRLNNHIILNGVLENDAQYIEFKKICKMCLEKERILHLFFTNANTIDASILGYILKLYEKDKVEIFIVVNNSRLYNFLQNVDFHKFFNIKIKEC